MAQIRRAYPFHLIEPKWQRFWEQEETFRAFNPGDTVPVDHPFGLRHGLAGRTVQAADLPPKYYILDMFPYPSGAGLHVGHPEGYTATDILARYRRACGWHVLHPMGWDAFGLPAEQYAVKTGQHPRRATEANIATFKRQIKSLGFSYDWRREVDTTDPAYFKWTQWIFLQLYNSYFDPVLEKARPIGLLEDALSDTPQQPTEVQNNPFLRQMHEAWRQVPPDQRPAFRRHTLDRHRLAYVAEMPVWWCEQLGTVLANEEVIDGRSEVGGFPVVRRPMRQWMLRITAYADRLLRELDLVDWPESIKEMQRNWIGRSEGAEVEFRVDGSEARIVVFTTRPDTLFGATYMVLAPEHPLVDQLTTPAQRPTVEAYRAAVAQKSDLERTDLAREKTGVFIGAYAINPVNHQRIPIWIADYVLISYGTGAIMAVPAHDTRDLEFATKFHLPVVQVVQPPDPQTDWRGFVGEGISVNSTGPEVSITGLPTPEAKRQIVAWLESKGLGRRAVNYKLRDWLFSRQRYWGEPFPIVWRQDAQGHWQPEALPESALPVLPPDLDDYKPTPDGQPPLARARQWVLLPDGAVRETNTMPQWAGSCWYYLRYLDPKNDRCFTGRDPERYWMGGGLRPEFPAPGTDQARATASATLGAGTGRLGSRPAPGVDLYVGGTEHAVLHLLYARFWHKVLYDLGHVSTPEPFFKLVNQGLILGEDGQKMSKSRGNVINPDDILQAYGADAFRMYEMFMGPLEMVKPWSTQGVEGVYRFLGRVWRLFVDAESETQFEQAATLATSPGPELLDLVRLSPSIQPVPASPDQLKTLHACIKKVTEDLEGLRFNTAISALMIFVNEALGWPVKPASVLRTFLQLLAPFAPHLAEELWARLHQHLGQKPPSLTYEPWPQFDPAWLAEATLEIVVQVNGKVRGVVVVPAEATQPQLEQAALNCEKAKSFWAGKPIKRLVVVPRKLVNIVTG